MFHDLKHRIGSSEETKVTMIASIKDNDTVLTVEKTLKQNFPITEYDNAMHLFDRLTCGEGRRAYKPEDLAHHYTPKILDKESD